jgi:predicted  nucleic acid-binding Zn-ribbon protein
MPGSLWRLYQLDEAIVQRERDLAALDDGGALLAEIEGGRARLKALRQRCHTAVSAQKSREMELRSLLDKRARCERDLYSGRTTNPKELETMQQEIAMLDRQRARLEDQVLTAMEEAEELSRAVANLDATLARGEAEHRELVETSVQQRHALEAEVADLRAQRDAAAHSIDEAALQRYESVRAKLPHPVARAEDGSCERCHVLLPARLLERLEDPPPGALIVCPGCGRILVAS